MKLKGINH